MQVRWAGGPLPASPAQSRASRPWARRPRAKRNRHADSRGSAAGAFRGHTRLRLGRPFRLNRARRHLHRRCLTVARGPPSVSIVDFAADAVARIPLARALSNRKRPAGEAGRFWGYYREERTATARMAGRNPACRAKSCPAKSGCNRLFPCLTVARVWHRDEGRGDGVPLGYGYGANHRRSEPDARVALHPRHPRHR
jgi:hypothetical protein